MCLIDVWRRSGGHRAYDICSVCADVDGAIVPYPAGIAAVYQVRSPHICFDPGRAAVLYQHPVTCPICVYALVRVNVCAIKDVGRLEASIVSLKVATMVSLEVLTTARAAPEADPALLRRTVQLFRDFPTSTDDDVRASSPYLGLPRL
jgi:hypothetical protein